MSAKRVPPIGFAHRGARAELPENTLPAFVRALELGATGLESDVWITADNVAVLDHDGVVKSGLRKRPIREVDKRSLPAHIPMLEELYDRCGTAFELSLDLKDPAALDAVLSAARNVGGLATERLWLCDSSWQWLAEWRHHAHDVQLVDSTRLKRLKDGPERHAAQLADAGIDAVNMHYSDWNLGLTTLFHRFDRYTFGWDAQHPRMLNDLRHWEIDAVYCDNPATMMAALQ